jgi:hypothetical protein
MKYIIVLLVIFSLQAVAQVPTKKNINDQFVWNASQSDIKLIEKSKLLYENRDCLFYEKLFITRKCTLIYEFDNNKLIRTMYFLDKKYKVNYDTYISLVQGLNKKYGKFRAVEKWKNEYFKSDRKSWDKAVQLGDVSFVAFLDQQGISVIYSRMDGEISIIVYFYNPNIRIENQ